jgi:hypothetical protein
MSESCGELIISAEELARIQAACQQRAAEQPAAGAPQCSPDALGLPQSANGKFVNLTNLTEAERFSAAVADMPAKRAPLLPSRRANFFRCVNRRAPRTGSSAKRVPASVAGAASAFSPFYGDLRRVYILDPY